MLSLFSETLIISGTMILLCGVPLYSEKARRNSKFFFLLGTGALSGILAFDLLPEVFEIGGSSSLWIMGAVWLFYSLAHLGHVHHHDALLTPEAAKPGEFRLASYFFLASMIAHCLASGMLLVISGDLAAGFGRTVFVALLAHKSYEALTVSSILLEKQRSKLASLLSVALYALSLPAGVGITLVFRRAITQNVALVAASLAVGTLLGCLIFDFLLPSLTHVRNRRHDLAWIAAGLLATQLVMRVL
jgi:zinc transporter ZupT